MTSLLINNREHQISFWWGIILNSGCNRFFFPSFLWTIFFLVTWFLAIITNILWFNFSLFYFLFPSSHFLLFQNLTSLTQKQHFHHHFRMLYVEVILNRDSTWLLQAWYNPFQHLENSQNFHMKEGERLIESLQHLHLLFWHQCREALTRHNLIHPNVLSWTYLPSCKGQRNIVSTTTCCRLILSWRVSSA